MNRMLRFLILVFLLGGFAVRAQAVPVSDVKVASPVVKVMPDVQTDIDKPFRGSFFLTPLEIAAIQQALKGQVMKQPTLAAANAPVPAHRVIRLSGVYYRSAKDWIVWMNGMKMTPGDLLPQIVSIHVSPSSEVSLKWYDVGLNKVLALTLSPNETYDITTGILLPGAH